MSPKLQCVANSSGGECSCCPLQLSSQRLDISIDPDMLQCFLNLPSSDVAENNPVDLEWIHTQQNTDMELATKTTKYPDQCNKLIDGLVIVYHTITNEDCLTQ